MWRKPLGDFAGGYGLPPKMHGLRQTGYGAKKTSGKKLQRLFIKTYLEEAYPKQG